MVERNISDIQPIQIINRTGTGRRDVFEGSPVTFGRDSSCLVVVTGSYVSRCHGELRFVKGCWRLISLSSNGVEINGKRVSRKGRDLHDQDIVSIGGEVVFQVRFDLVASEQAVTQAVELQAGQADQADQAASSHLSRVWIGVGIWWGVMLVIAVAGYFIFGGSEKLDSKSVKPLSQSQIREEIFRPIQPAEHNEREARDALRDARERMERPYAEQNQMYLALVSYRRALSLSGKRHFDDSQDEMRYLNLRDQLLERMYQLYNDAYGKLRSGQYPQAARAFEKLSHVYPDSTSKIHRNIEAQRSIAVANSGKRRRRRRR